MALKIGSKSAKMKLDNEKSTKIKKPIVFEDIPTKNKHIKFDNDEDDDDGNDENGEAVFSNETKNKSRPDKKGPSKKSEKNRKNAMDIGSHWYQAHAEYNTAGELVELKNQEIEELTNHCRKCFEEHKVSFEKRNPSDVKWLKTALHKGTSKDRANAGALLVQSNPLANLETLEALIAFTKVTNKNSTDSVDVASELFVNALLPPDRKLISFALRGADWKALKKNESVDKSTKDQIFAYWHFETVIKDQYFEFLRNLQNAIQSGQDTNKKQAIICATKLLCYSPEKEQMLLSMLVNKLGDPSKMIASKALHHLTEVSLKHPAMCGVIANETEKFLFRNNITEHAQHFALCFLSQIAPHGTVDVSIKLVNICLSFFKVVVNKGLINSKIMQAILLCLKHSITDVVQENQKNPGTDCGLMSKDTQDTIYRLIHFANIKVSLQTLALLLQIITAIGFDSNNSHNRFYNALYKKLLDPELSTCGSKYAALLLHIVHRAIYVDRNKARAQAFIKRLLQVSMYLPASMTCGCLIIINKILRTRSELNHIEICSEAVAKREDAEIVEKNDELSTMETTKAEKTSPYDPFHRVPEFAGAQYSTRTELSALQRHYHPTVRVFAQNIIENTPIKFYGDPLVDFSLTQFLDRFAFKNPKKQSENKSESLVPSMHHKHYTPYGSRGKSVKDLNASSVTEDEKFIFEYLNQKRERQQAHGLSDEPNESEELVNDDEFDAYLDSLGGKKKKSTKGDDDLDFMGDFGEGGKNDDANDEDWDDDDGDDDDSDDGAQMTGIADDDDDGGEFDDSDDEGSISLDGSDDPDIFESDEDPENDSEDDEPKSKRMKMVSNKDFQKKLKHTNNMSSLFAAAEDFSEMLEETSKGKKHGTLGEIFNKDKSSEKQMEWERARLKQSTGFKGNPNKKKRNRSQGQKRRGESSTKNKISGKRKQK